jgi:hypothetical protein
MEHQHFGCCYRHGEAVNAAYINKALDKSLAIYKRIGPDCHFSTVFCLRTTHLTANSVQESVVTKGVKTIVHLPYSQDITPEVAGLSLSQDSFKTSWVGVLQTIAEDEFATVF